MKTRRIFAGILVSVGIVALAAPAAVSAHPMTYQGTVLAVEAARVQVRAVDPMTKKEGDLWFVVDKDTTVKRGAKTVAYADAKIAVDERIVVIVDMDAETKMLAQEIRLAAKE